MTKLELWNEHKSNVSDCYDFGEATQKCSICGNNFKQNEYCMSTALCYGKDDYVIFMCKKCWLGEEKNLKPDLDDLGIIRNNLYECVDLHINKGFHFEDDDEYEFFMNHIAKQGVPIYWFWVNNIENEYKTTVRIRIRYKGTTQFWMRDINLHSASPKFKLPKFESGEKNND